jgi:hypothetical protein
MFAPKTALLWTRQFSGRHHTRRVQAVLFPHLFAAFAAIRMASAAEFGSASVATLQPTEPSKGDSSGTLGLLFGLIFGSLRSRFEHYLSKPGLDHAGRVSLSGQAYTFSMALRCARKASALAQAANSVSPAVVTQYAPPDDSEVRLCGRHPTISAVLARRARCPLRSRRRNSRNSSTPQPRYRSRTARRESKRGTIQRRVRSLWGPNLCIQRRTQPLRGNMKS